MMPKRPVPLEREEQAAIVRLLTRAGWWVYSTSQGYRRDPGGTRMTPGLPDLYCLGPDPLPTFWVECKRRTGRLRGAQTEFLDRAARSDVEVFVWYSANDCRLWLAAEGFLVRGPDGDVFPYLLAGDRPTGPVTRFEDI